MAQQKNSPNTKSDKSKRCPLKPNPNGLIKKKTISGPKKQYTCVVCGTQVVDHKLHEHEESHRHKQLLAFLLASQPDKKNANNTGTLPSDTLKAGSKWKCFACGKSLPPPPKPQDHLALPTHASAVKDLQAGFDERTVSMKPAQKNQILRGSRMAFV